MSQEVEQALDAANRAQQHWSRQLLRFRLKCIGKVAGAIAQEYPSLVRLIDRPNASTTEKLASEILPLADACRFTARVGRQVLAPRSYSIWYGAWWMGRIGVQQLHEPWGTILILCPDNYPLFLPGVQIIQALAAGNAVLVKPAPGGEAVLERFRELLLQASIPDDLVQVLPTHIDAAHDAIRQGVDKVVLTGSVATGRAVQRLLAETLTPSTMELSGCDAVFVLPQADLQRVAKSILYALQLNGGASCIGPRRVFVTRAHYPALVTALAESLAAQKPRTIQVAPEILTSVRSVVQLALDAGAELVSGELPLPTSSCLAHPIVLHGVKPEMQVARSDLFAPILSIIEVDDMTEALDADRICPFSLGASVFGPRAYAEHWAGEIEAGCVVVNDIVVPTADPRVSFGGRDHSGWGVTRGPEGLLEMARPKTVCVQQGKWLPHLDEDSSSHQQMLELLLQLFHASSWRDRWSALRSVIRSARNKS